MSLPMTKTLEQAIEKTRTLPSNRQDEIGEMMLAIFEQDTSGLRLSPDQQAEVRRRLAAPRPLVPEAEMEAFFRKHGR